LPTVTEIAPDVYRITVFFSAINLQFNHFLVKDDEPLLFHTGLRGMFPEVKEGLSKVIDPARLRWISWSHFESDECGALKEWMAFVPNAQPACGAVGALVSVNDFVGQEVRILGPQEPITTGKYRFRYYPTPQLPHGWDAGVLFEETERTLFSSDLFHQDGECEPLSHSSVIDRCRETLANYQAGPLAGYVPYTPNTELILQGLASLKPKTVAAMHGSCFCGDCSQSLLDLGVIMKELLSKPFYKFGA
jgi:flavorubredoxin